MARWPWSWLILAAGSLSPNGSLRLLARACVNLTRGVPTSLFVIAAGIGTMHLVSVSDLPIVFPGTTAAFQHLAWAIMLALALGSAGHLAEIFRAARSALGRPRLEQAAVRVFGLSYEDNATLAFTTTARNSEAVIGVAVSAFPGHPLVYLAIILGPIVELPMLLLIARMMLGLKDRIGVAPAITER